MFLDMTLRSVKRHKIRSFLTAFGVTLAIAAIVSLGSISEGINIMVQEQMTMASDLIVVTEKGALDLSTAFTAERHIDRDIIDELAQIDGVEEISYGIEAMDPTYRSFVIGFLLEHLDMYGLENIEFEEGGWFTGGSFEAVVGYQRGEVDGWAVGDELVLNGDEYTISGVLEEMSGFMDYGIIVPFDSAAETYDMQEYVTEIHIKPVDVRESERIANEIDETFDSVEAITMAEAVEIAEEIVGQIRIMTLAVGIIASVVASIGIINTMMMIVAERKREFGIMKALGAEQRVILFLVLQEGVVLALLGGVVGLLLGALGTEMLNQAIGRPMATVTPLLAVLSLLYGLGIAIVASLYPAYQAVMVNPVDAMREA